MAVEWFSVCLFSLSSALVCSSLLSSFLCSDAQPCVFLFTLLCLLSPAYVPKLSAAVCAQRLQGENFAPSFSLLPQGLTKSPCSSFPKNWVWASSQQLTLIILSQGSVITWAKSPQAWLLVDACSWLFGEVQVSIRITGKRAQPQLSTTQLEGDWRENLFVYLDSHL